MSSISALAAAIRFLTILPLPGAPAHDADFDRTITRAMSWFPMVGLLIGALACGIGLLTTWLWPHELVRASIIVIFLAWLTAGLHLDGLSDTFDATLSWRSRERMLEIMKDSRIGAMGAIALVSVLLLKVAFIAAAGDQWWHAVLLAPVLGRWADIYGIFFYPAAREGGLGRNFRDLVRRRDFFIATAWVVIIAIVLGFSRWQLITQHLGAIVTVALVSTWFCRQWVRQLGGLTGDTYGALSEIGEVVALGVMSAHWSLAWP